MGSSAYPLTLPTPSVSTTTPAERRLLSDVSGGPQQARGVQLDYLGVQQVEWSLLNATQAALFNSWWTDDLLSGGAWFSSSWPAPQGIGSLVRRFMGAPTWSFIAGGYWRVSAQVQVRGRGLAPQTGDRYFDSNVVLMHCDGPNGGNTFVDSVGRSPIEHVVTTPSLTYDATNPLFGTSSISFGASGANAIGFTDAPSVFALTAVPWTLEYAVNLPDLRNCIPWEMYNYGVGFSEFVTTLNNGAAGNSGVRGRVGGVDFSFSVPGVVRTGWQRHRLVRTPDSLLQIYADGNLVGQFPISGSFPSPYKAPWIGQNMGAATTSWIDEIRLTVGVARSTSTYSLDTGPFPNSK